RRLEPGFVCAVLDILIAIFQADRTLIAIPFLEECVGDLYAVIEPSFISPERGVTERFALLLGTMLKWQPLSSKASILNYSAIPTNHPPANHGTQGGSTNSGQQQQQQQQGGVNNNNVASGTTTTGTSGVSKSSGTTTAQSSTTTTGQNPPGPRRG